MKIGLVHTFSCELDPDKRQYILDAFDEVQHVFDDVRSFSSGSAWCYVCGKTHSTSNLPLDLLLCGPSCKDVSSFDLYRVSIVLRVSLFPGFAIPK